MTEINIKDKKFYLTLFDNITDLANYLKRRRKPGRDNASDTSSEHFSGTKDFKEALEFMKYGDEELYKKIKEEKRKINIEKMLGNVSNRQRYEQRIYGCIPNVPIYLIGSPINMINPEKNMLSHRILNIFLDIAVHGDVDKEDIIRNGIAYLNVIDLLEKKGYRCNLFAGTSSKYGAHHMYMYVKVKTDREPLNLKKICFPLASPSMLRRIYFKWAEVFDYDLDITNDGYGRCEDEKTTKEYLDKFLKSNFIVWSYNEDGHSRSIEKIIENLKNKYGIQVD